MTQSGTSGLQLFSFLARSVKNPCRESRLAEPNGKRSGTGGGTYCAVASLQLMGFIEDDILSKTVSSSGIDVSLLLNWCLQRQAVDGGFQGRANKPSDTCYAFWIGAVLRILNGYKFVDKEALRRFLLTCQSQYGGFSKYPGEMPDLYHSYYGYTAFSLLEEPGLNPLCAELGMTDFFDLGNPT
ncbi:hypothetical protein Q3G72_007328 [Acer saccharum]|nr:hypothetical protein Q3G72_007328 [Acer saccharum]